jgi:hypothetical protein
MADFCDTQYLVNSILHLHVILILLYTYTRLFLLSLIKCSGEKYCYINTADAVDQMRVYLPVPIVIYILFHK